MILRKLIASSSIVSLFATTVISTSVLAQDSERNITLEGLSQIDEAKVSQIQKLTKKHRGNLLRPEACPMESEKHKDILTKIESIKTLFKDNCLDMDQNRLDQILEGATSIQQEIDNVSNAVDGSGSGEGDDSDSSSGYSASIGSTQISGEEIANIVSNINQIYKDRSCKTLNNNQSFLEKTAGVISDFAKIGLLVPNEYALMVAGGGIALSSILLILNSLFDKRFNFDKTADRQTFIKLNCAFYDIRRDIQQSGFLDVLTEEHSADAGEVKTLVEELDSRVKALGEEYQSRLEAVENDKSEYVGEGMGDLLDISETVAKAKSILEKELTTETDKMKAINDLTLLYDSLKTAIETYLALGLSKIPVMDQLLLNQLSQLDYVGQVDAYMSLINKPVKEFAESYAANLKFHVNRVLGDSSNVQADLEKKYYEVTKINEKTVEVYLEELKTDFDEKGKELAELFNNLNQVDVRLKRIIGDADFSSTDDGSENIVSILSDYDTIAEQVYGKFGKNFLEYTTDKAKDENKEFLKKFKKFAKNHLNVIKSEDQYIYQVPNPAELPELNVKFACQDAQPFRRRWKFAESLTQQGYDFVATNADLFHSDIPRVFLGRSGGRWGIHNWLSKFEKIQMHHKSALFAKKILDGKQISEKNRKKYLKRDYLGKMMLRVNDSKKYAVLLQKVIEKYDCATVIQLD